MLKQRRFIRWQQAKAKGIQVEEVYRYIRATIRCGEGACATSEPEEVGLVPLIEECYHSGAEYHQTADEIHFSYPENGTVTIIRRAPFQDEDDSATVFWQPNEQFVSAEPRPATADEIMKAYILTEADFEKLLLRIDRDPKHGTQGGSSAGLSESDRRVYDEAHRFYNYQVRTWIDEVKQ